MLELIRACVESDRIEAWLEFVNRFRRPIGLSALRVAQRWSENPYGHVEDLIQETFLKLCADRCERLHRFAVHHPDSVEAYVRTVALNVAIDHFKALRSQKRGRGEVAQMHELLEPRAHSSSLGGPDAIQQSLLLREIDQHLQNGTSSPRKIRDRLIFWLHYQQGMSAEAIASVPAVGLNAKGVESALRRLTILVRKCVTAPPVEEKGKTDPGRKGLGSANSY